MMIVCGSLADGRNRFPREGDSCECAPGWTGLNCNGESRLSDVGARDSFLTGFV